MKDVIVVRFLQ